MKRVVSYTELPDPEWQLVDSKNVVDSDGFITDYTLWHDDVNGAWCCVFGDAEVYTPFNSFPDAQFESEWEAREWFEDYTGFAEDGEEYAW